MKKELFSPRSFFLCAALVIAAAATGSARAELVYVTLQSSVVSFDISSGVGPTIAATKTTVASGLTEAMGLVFGGDGDLYVLNNTPGTVSRINVGTQAVTGFASGFTDPRGITYSSTGNAFYVANSGNPGSISLVTSSGTASNYLTFGTNTSPYGLALDAAGAMYSANNASYSISKIVGGTPSTFTTFTPGQGVRGVAVAANGNVYSTGNFGLSVTNPEGTSTTNLVSSGLGFAFGVAFDSTGDILVADYVNQTINAYDTAGTLQYSFSTGAGTSNRPRYVAFDVPGSGFNQVVPEPSTCAMALAGIACGGYSMWRRRKRT